MRHGASVVNLFLFDLIPLLNDASVMAATAEYVKLAQSLPPKLLRFFARYPPPSLSHAPSQVPASTLATSLDTSLQDPNASDEEATIVTQTPPRSKAYNPFKSHKHPVTGVWHSPRFSLRQQADLVKLARNNGVEELLPYTPKKTEVRLRKREQFGLRVKGTGEGQKVKGKKEERTMKSRLDRREKAMLEMPAMIEQWKEVREFRNVFQMHADQTTGWPWTRLEEVAQVSEKRTFWAISNGCSLAYTRHCVKHCTSVSIGVLEEGQKYMVGHRARTVRWDWKHGTHDLNQESAFSPNISIKFPEQACASLVWYFVVPTS